MKLDYDDLSGSGWIVMIAVIVFGIWLIVNSASNWHHASMKMALEAGCSQTFIPGRAEIIWTDCKKGLPPSQ
jgi:hypothetical protein